MKVAIVYDRINKWGGAERVLLALHELFPNAPLFTSVYYREKAAWAKNFQIRSSFLQNFPFAKGGHELYPILMPQVFEAFDFAEYDVVISVTSEAAKGIITKPGTLHICYCLTPTRYLWSGYDQYFQTPLVRFLSYPFVRYLRMWERIAATRPDIFVAISHEVQDRIKRYYRRDSTVIYPPVSLFEKYAHLRRKQGEYYLVVSRLVPYKKVELAIKACNTLKRELVIVGVGSEMTRLKRIAGPTVTFKGSLSDDELANVYVGAKAVIFPGFEDFGIVMGEALGFGKPVIAYKKGGALDLIKDKKTGILFQDQTIKSLTQAILNFEKTVFDARVLESEAKHFSKRVFKDSISSLIDQALQKTSFIL